MNIQYLQKLQDNPERDGFVNVGMPESEILVLEQQFNSGDPFPIVLKELLYLAGNRCVWLDFSLWENQQEMQNEERSELIEDGLTIARPYYFIDLRSHGQPLIIFLDEGDNPPLYQVLYNLTNNQYYIDEGGGSLIDLIESGINNYKDGGNPF